MRAAVAVATVRGAEELRGAPAYPEPEIIQRARAGDAAALAELFDAVIPDLYGYAFMTTRRQLAAASITGGAIKRLPALLRHRRWQSVGALRAELKTQVQRDIAGQARREARDAGLTAMHARLRHFVLGSTSIVALAYFGVVAL